jgi:uncharacterized protein
MTASLKRLLLVAISLVVIPLLGISLWSSLTEPQITDRLQLYQTDLLLHVNELTADSPESENLLAARNAVLGDNPLKTALEQYQDVHKTAETSLKKFQAQLEKAESEKAESEKAQSKAQSDQSINRSVTQAAQAASNLRKQQTLIDQLNLRIGLLQVQQNDRAAAQTTWSKIGQPGPASSVAPNQTTELTRVLISLWNEPPQILPNAEEQLQTLQGWFRYVGLSRLYQLQQRTEALTQLQAQEQQIAQQTLVKLALVSTVPAIGSLVGVAIILSLGIRRLLRSRAETRPDLRSESRLDKATDTDMVISGLTSGGWQVPWDWETIAWVLIVGFLFAGQVAIPGVLGLGSNLLNQQGVSISLAATAGRSKAFYTLAYYLLMAGTGLFVLYQAVKPYAPLPEDWFRLTGKRNWVVWGLGGYFVALPLMFVVSLLNQQIWQGQGGSNPLLQIVLEEGDPVALLIFFLTAAVAAPIFEEILFRGFLLPSLTRYLPVWGAIALSGLIFAMAHLSLAEVLPLATLGVVLGIVYTRSRGLLASMLLHSLWNSVTMIGLFILGSGAT